MGLLLRVVIFLGLSSLAASSQTLTLNQEVHRTGAFKLKRGYTATFAQNPNGTVTSRNYVAQDADLEVSVMPTGLDNSVSFIRVFPWRWTGKRAPAMSIPRP